jgi:hypothetical protein
MKRKPAHGIDGKIEKVHGARTEMRLGINNGPFPFNDSRSHIDDFHAMLLFNGLIPQLPTIAKYRDELLCNAGVSPAVALGILPALGGSGTLPRQRARCPRYATNGHYILQSSIANYRPNYFS